MCRIHCALRSADPVGLSNLLASYDVPCSWQETPVTMIIILMMCPEEG